MAKKLLLVAASLGIVLVLFFVYHLSTTSNVDRSAALSPIRDEELLGPAAATQPVRVLKIRGVPVPPGSRPRVTVYNDKGDAKIRFRARTWEPLGETEFHMEEPEIELLMPGGQITHIRSDRGNVIVQKSEKGNYDPKRGRLEGNVRIFIDRTTKKWRDASPERRGPEQHPEQLIHVWLDEVSFDLDLARLASEGPLRVQSVEANIEGTGLVLRWNEVDNRIEELEIARGKVMELRRGGGLVDFAMPGTERESKKQRSAKGERRTLPPGPRAAMGSFGLRAPTQASQPASAGIGLLANQPAAVDLVGKHVSRRSSPRNAEPEPSAQSADRGGLDDLKKLRKDRIDTYVAEFEGGVVVEQRRGPKVSGQLQADELSLTFEFSSKHREAAKEQPTTRPRPDGADKGAADETKLRLTWTGKMVMRPAQRTAEEATGERLDVIATGEAVRLVDEQGEAVCRKLEYHNETQKVWLHGTDERPVRISAGKTRSMTGRMIFLDRNQGIAEIDGPGSMMDIRQAVTAIEVPRGPARPEVPKSERVEIRWRRGVWLVFDVARLRQKDPKTGEVRVRSREYVKSAVFEGAAEMVQADQSIRADRVEMLFGRPRSRTSLADNIEKVNATGNVRLTHDQDLVECQKLLVEMTIDRDGRNVPKVAHAFGKVLAKQRDRQIEAEDHLEVRFAAVKKAPEPLDMRKARAAARARGLDPDKIDWRAVEAKRQPRTVLRITGLQAFGNVKAVDPDQGLDLKSDVLQCELSDGQNIDRATVVGTEHQTAKVKLQDYLIRGRRIEIDLPAQQASVPGRGNLEFLSRRDLDGKELSEPVPVSVSWAGQMTLTGEYNVGIFRGDVHAVSRSSNLDCQELRIDFAPVPRHERVAQAGTPRARGPDLWIFGPLVSAGRAELPPDVFRDRFNKRPIHITARGEAVALRSAYDKRGARLVSRMRIAGPQITVDLKSEAMNVEGRGDLLIEDYRLPTRRGRQAGAARRAGDSLLGGFERSGPSQTLFTWSNAMSFFVGQNLAYFDRMVHMTHHAGSAMVLAREIADAMNVDVKNLAAMKQRRATLDCDNLLVRFRADPRVPAGKENADVPATDLSELEARGRVILADSGKTLIGERVTYSHESGLITVLGSGRADARILDEHGRQFMWTGPELIWNRNNDQVSSKHAMIVASGR